MKLLKLISLSWLAVFTVSYLNAQTTTFNYTGAMQTYVVPVGITELSIDMYGAKGGDGGLGTKIGGFGGRVQTTITVIPGQTLNIFVGGLGQNGDCVSATPFLGGYNGGGDGYYCGASGGGASDIRTGGTTLNDRVVIAGGGGGGGDDYPTGDKGGDGGGLIGANGEYGVDPNASSTGKGGTQSAGGIGGNNPSPSVDDGLPGVLGVGGRSSTTYAGGGGGGGYYGGGGGAAAGGGGGSSYSDAVLTTGTIHTQGYNSGNGQIIITELCSPPFPDLTSLPDLLVECSVPAPTAPTATNCYGSFTGSPDVSFPITTQGSTTVTWTYDDGNGNTSTQTQNVVITDVTAPVPDVTNLVDYSDECPVELATIGGTPTATDNCSGAMIGVPDVIFPITASGITTITWTYDDGNGNISTQTQDVTITPIDNGITQVDAVTLSADAVAAAYSYQWVDCDNGNAPISGATSQTFTPTVAGNYACVIDNGFCTVTTACLTSSVGIVENSFGSDLILFPNPTDGDFSIDLGENTQLVTVTMTDLRGKVIQSTTYSNEQLLNLKIEEPAGIYLLMIESGDKKAVIRLIKE